MKRWQRRFDVPITLPDGNKLITLRDAATYIAELPKVELQCPEWQAAMVALLLIAETDGPTTFARIGIMRALSRQESEVNWLASQEAGEKISDRQIILRSVRAIFAAAGTRIKIPMLIEVTAPDGRREYWAARVPLRDAIETVRKMIPADHSVEPSFRRPPSTLKLRLGEVRRIHL
jgi:hypothetical protein